MRSELHENKRWASCCYFISINRYYEMVLINWESEINWNHNFDTALQHKRLSTWCFDTISMVRWVVKDKISQLIRTIFNLLISRFWHIHHIPFKFDILVREMVTYDHDLWPLRPLTVSKSPSVSQVLA